MHQFRSPGQSRGAENLPSNIRIEDKFGVDADIADAVRSNFDPSRRQILCRRGLVGNWHRICERVLVSDR
jgi:hypothetical protein